MMVVMAETQELVGLVPWTVVFQILNLFLQMFLIKKFLFKPVNDILAKRQEMTDAKLKEAAEAKQAADTAREEYEQNMARAKEEAAGIISAAQKEAAEAADAVVREAQAQAAGMKARAEAQIEQERKKAINTLKDEVGDLAMDIAGKVVEKEISADDHRKLIDEFINAV